MVDVKVPNGDIDMDLIEDNPEAIFDFLTIKSLQDRYSHATPPRRPIARKPSEKEPVYQNDAEFETYVQQFPIDDSIAECFALTSEPDERKSTTKFVSGGKRPQASSKYNKLKKKFAWVKQTGDENQTPDEEPVSRDSKRSKKGGVFSKRHKWRGLGGSKKAVLFSDQSPSPNTADVREEIPPRVLDLSPNNDSNSISDSQITSYSETLTPDDQTVPLMKGDHSRHTDILMNSSFQGVVNLGADLSDEGEEFFMTIFRGDTTSIIQRLEDIPPDNASKLRDHHGNTLLHHAVLLGNQDAVKFIIEKYPDMTSDMNQDNATAVEVATKNGKYDCLRVILERNQRRKSLGPSLINRLLNISAQYGQGDCLNLLLSYLSHDPQTVGTLPGDNRGNTAAHLAAKNGHLHCLQILMAAGYNVTSENLIRQRPLHIAHQSRNETCFSYLLLLDVCEELLRMVKGQTGPIASPSDVSSSMFVTLQQTNISLNKYQMLLSDISQSLDESRGSILQTLSKLHNDLELFIKHTDCDTAYKRKAAREKLDELESEIERLEDIFDFSPIVDMEGTITKLLADVDTSLKPFSEQVDGRDNSPQNLEVSMADDDLGYILSSLVKDIYKEFMLENWDVGHIFQRYLGAIKSKSGSDITHNTSSEMDSSGERLTMMASFNKKVAGHTSLTGNTQVINQSSQTDFEKTKCETCQMNKPEKDKSNTDQSEENCEQDSMDKEISDFVGANSESFNSVKQNELRGTSAVENPLSDSDSEEIIQTVNSLEESTLKLEPTERPFAKLLSLDERMDLLISGERSKLKHSNSSDTLVENTGSPEAPESMYTTTFTSITSDSTSGLSEWYSKLGFSSLETSPDDATNEITSETLSYWWDTGDDREKTESSNFKKPDSFQENVRRQIHLNLENEDSTLEELRRNRLLSHLHAVQQTRYPSGNYTERITTASGEVIGGFPSRDDTSKIVVDVNGALQRRHESRTDNKQTPDHQNLFTLEDAINGNHSRTEESYGRYNLRSRDVFEVTPSHWADTSYTDDEDSRSIPWYEIEDINQMIRWKSDTDTSDGTVTPQSYV